MGRCGRDRSRGGSGGRRSGYGLPDGRDGLVDHGADLTGHALDGPAEVLHESTDDATLLRRCLCGGGRAGSEHEREQHEGSGDPDAREDDPEQRAPGVAQRLVHALTS